MGRAEKASSTVACTWLNPSKRPTPKATSGKARCLMVSTLTAKTLTPASEPNCRPAPAAIRPKIKDDAPMRLTLGSSHAGIRKPSKLATKPEAVAMIRGLRNSSRPKWVCDCLAMGQTAPMLKIGTHTPMSTAISSSPSAPAKRSAMARPMKELNRKPTCAAPACSRASMCRPKKGKWGRA